jgi:hypothetical protein
MSAALLDGEMFGFVVSHPRRDEAASWMGHPGFVACVVLKFFDQYFDLIAYVRPIVNWNEFPLVGGSEAGALFR